MSKYILKKNEEWKTVEMNGEMVEIPKDWEVKKLIDLCFISSGIPAPKLFVDFKLKETIPFFRVSNLSSKKKSLTEKDTLEFLPHATYKTAKEGSILIAKSGESIRQKYRSILQQDSVIVGHIAAILPKSNSDYIYHNLRHFPPEDMLIQGSAMPSLGLGEISNFCLLSPPNQTKEKIATLLSTQESLISDLESLLSKQKQRFSYLSEELLSGRLRVREVNGKFELYKNPDDNWQTVEMNGEMVEIPKDWEVSTIGQLFDVVAGQSPSPEVFSSTGILFHQGNSCFQSKYIDHSKARFISKPSKNVPPNTILFSVRAPVGDINITQKAMSLGRGLAGLLPKNGEINLHYYLLKNAASNIAKLGQGAIFDAISYSELKSFQLTAPKTHELGSVLETQESLISDLESLLSKQKQRFSYLSEVILSGEYKLLFDN